MVETMNELVLIAGVVVVVLAIAAAAVVALRHTVGFVTSMAGDKLSDHLAAGSRELELRSGAFDARVGEMRDELARMTDLVSTMQRERAEQHGSLIAGLEQATRASSQLADTTQHLREALANPRARGQWGERMADDVLRAAGFVDGVNYRKQKGLTGGGVPDFTFLLPGGWLLNMDVKFPVENYLRFLECDADADRERCRAQFLRDVRERVKELDKRGYLDGDETLDELLLFVPNEAVYAFIHEHDPELLEVALTRRIVLCSPITLFAVLAVIRQAVDQFRFERTSDEILRCLTGFRQQWEKVCEAVDTVAKRFDTAQRGMEELVGPRRRQLERQLDAIDDLASRRGVERESPRLREVG
jgi:DNA recombination protein RmuC